MEPRTRGPRHQRDGDFGGRPAGARLRLLERPIKQASAFNSLGQDLRNARKGKGLELSQISDRLKISKRHLNAIEESNVEALPPGNVYLIGYTRAYANYLGLNTRQCVEKLKSEIAERKSASQVVTTTPQDDKLPVAIRHALKFLGFGFYDL